MGGSSYVVKSGDTFYGIAKQYGISLQQLMDSNKSVKPESLQVGTKLVIPAK